MLIRIADWEYWKKLIIKVKMGLQNIAILITNLQKCSSHILLAPTKGMYHNFLLLLFKIYCLKDGYDDFPPEHVVLYGCLAVLWCHHLCFPLLFCTHSSILHIWGFLRIGFSVFETLTRAVLYKSQKNLTRS